MYNSVRLTRRNSNKRAATNERTMEVLNMQNFTDTAFLNSVWLRSLQQNWEGICDSWFPKCGRDVVATMPFRRGDVIVDYHRKRVEGFSHIDYSTRTGSSEWVLQLKPKLLIDATGECCDCARCPKNHRLLGRLFNYAPDRRSNRSNVRLLRVQLGDEILPLLIAKRDIAPLEQLPFDYGVKNAKFL